MNKKVDDEWALWDIRQWQEDTWTSVVRGTGMEQEWTGWADGTLLGHETDRMVSGDPKWGDIIWAKANTVPGVGHTEVEAIQ